jgi:hypothetical protein
MQDFISISGLMFNKESIDEIKRLIIQSGMKRDYVKNLASEIREEQERGPGYGQLRQA